MWRRQGVQPAMAASASSFVLYTGLFVTVCALTFQKGYIAQGIVGIFIPLLWLIGALLPAKPGSPVPTRGSGTTATDRAPGWHGGHVTRKAECAA